MNPWDGMWEALRVGDVYPLPLAVETNWLEDGYEVNVIMLYEVLPTGGYSSETIWSYHQGYGDQSTQDVQQATELGLHSFAKRLRLLLAELPTTET